MNNWLETSLDKGITEQQFWEMTIGELTRAFKSLQRVEKQRAREKAIFDYNLADMIGRSIGRFYASSNKMPDISEVYPSLFDSKEIQEKRQEKQAELSALRFKQFAQSFNKRFHKEAAKEE
jgi:hypothetical protein